MLSYIVFDVLVILIEFSFPFQQSKISEKLIEDVYPKFTRILENILRTNGDNNNKSGYFVGDNVRSEIPR